MPWEILIAYGMDLVLGDPRWFPHPVRGFGWLIRQLEHVLRRGKVERLLGCLLPLILVGGTYGLTVWLLAYLARFGPWVQHGVTVVLLWTTLATRDLVAHSKRVYIPLCSGDLVKSRQMLGHIVGRDTDKLEEPGIVRATVETLAENVVDGVTAPLFYAFIGGAPAAMAYKAASTLDSMVGYRNERYREFGWASARLDDVLNFVPARLTGILIPGTAACLRLHAAQSWRIFWRDRKKHPSPNSAHAEAAFAGALQVQLGGTSTYGGVSSSKELLGEPIRPLEAAVIRQAQWLTWATSLVFLTIGSLLRLGIP